MRAAPLPDDIEFALRVAGRSPAAVAEAVQATGRDADTLVEAVRFYLQQALFGDGADAYRVLGVDRHADTERIRRHHKLLQAWLHPDRNADAWNDVFSTRINQAWMALRSDSARARYDADPSRAGAPAPGTARAPIALQQAQRLAPHWNAREEPGGRGPARWLALAGIASCAVLLGLVLFREAPPPVSVARAPAAAAPAVEPATFAAAPRQESDAAALAGLLAAGVPHNAMASEVVADAAPPEPPPPAKPQERVQPPLATRPAAPRPVPPPVRTPTSTAVAATRPPASASPPPRVIDTAPRAVVVEARPVPAPPPAASAPPPDPLLRMQEAQASLRTTLAFLSTPDGAAPPLWNDVRTAEDAARTRDALHARGRVRAIDVTGNHWVLRDDEARFGGSYATGGRASERGRLALRLVRREGLWLVADLRLEPAG